MAYSMLLQHHANFIQRPTIITMNSNKCQRWLLPTVPAIPLLPARTSLRRVQGRKDHESERNFWIQDQSLIMSKKCPRYGGWPIATALNADMVESGSVSKASENLAYFTSSSCARRHFWRRSCFLQDAPRQAGVPVHKCI